jgi:hypothetical protein
VTFASVHIPLLWSIGPALAALALVVWYWLRLSSEGVPPSRRRIRRTSLAIIAVTIPLLMTGLSVVDGNQQKNAYVIIWSLCLLCMLFIITTAVVDALNNIRLHREAKHDQLIHTAVTMLRATPPGESASRLVKDRGAAGHEIPGEAGR